MPSRRLLWGAAVVGVVLLGVYAERTLAQMSTARVGDVTRLQGEGTNVLVGYGLVTGLNGTGDGSKFLPTMRALATNLQRFGAEIETIEDVQATKNAAIVMVEVVIPDHGAREGDRLDVHVTALAAKDLHGGRLLSTPLIYQDRNVPGLFGFAQGKIVTGANTPTAGVIRGGGRIERDVFINVIADGTALRGLGMDSPWLQPDQTYLTLVIDEVHAGWSMAAAIAQALDKELGLAAGADRVALAIDMKNVVVLLPEHQRGDPASWIRDIEQTPILMESNEARVAINRATRTIVVTGDTRLSPVVVSQAGLTVTITNPSPETRAAERTAAANGETPESTLIEEAVFVPVDLTSRRGPNVSHLLEALNRLKVPFEDRVSILEQIHKAGKLHAKLFYEG